jgi:hypothetical protein
LHFTKEIKQIEKVNPFEEAAGNEPVRILEGHTLHMEIRPFEILTLRIELWAFACRERPPKMRGSG